MNKIDGWLVTTTSVAREEFVSRYAKAMTEVKPDADIWLMASSSKEAITDKGHGAGILDKCPELYRWLHKGILAADRLNRIVAMLPGRCPAYCRDLIRNVMFWSNTSTDGRWDANVDRWRRWGVMSLQKWAAGKAGQGVPVNTFKSIRKALVDLGLIEAKSAIHNGKTKLWIRATDRLAEIMLADDNAPLRHYFPKEKAVTAKKKAPRGISARHKQVETECKVLFKTTVNSDATDLTGDEIDYVWERLTKPIALSDKVEKAPYAPPGSIRWRRLAKALGKDLSENF